MLPIRRQGTHYVFVKHDEFSKISHVRTLSGDWLGCAVYDGLNIICLIHWETGQTRIPFSKPNIQVRCSPV